MKIVASICRVAGDRVALVAVQKSVTDHSIEADRYLEALAPAFPGCEVVLMGRDTEGATTFYGREDLNQKLSEVPLDRIPWQEMDVDL
ncbi:MAG: hypothetical protein MUE73_11935 [Planctomycetes bacterium]|jgi:hypothetical protein|nr:hypothetical protein [Planctomycetota bacterium]